MSESRTGRMLNRREYLKASLAATVAGLSAADGSSARAARAPNIVVIMSDEHNARVLGCHGNTLARTPNLDALAGKGVLFENAYCNSPLCVPSRLSFTSGKYCSRVGGWSNACSLPSDDVPSLPRVLNDAGYETVLCGKMHYDTRYRYGFSKTLEPQSLNQGHMNGKGGRRPADDLRPKPGISSRFDSFITADTSEHMEHDKTVTASASQFLRERTPEDRPFFLLAGYITPHFPLTVPEPYWRHFEGKVPAPNIPEGHLDALAPNYKHIRIGFNVEDVPRETVIKGRELYYGLVEWFDDQVGQMLGSLDNSAVADNTMVVYTSDHGENMGEHGLWWKNVMFETAAYIPLVVSWPGRWAGGQRRTGVCSLVDVVQTIVDMAGGKAPGDWDGDSLAPYLDDAGAAWKDFAVSEYYAHNIASGFVMYRKGTMKYVYHTPADADHAAFRELYDLENDPDELTNLAGLPEHAETLARMHAAFVAELGEDPDVTEERARVELAMGYEA